MSLDIDPPAAGSPGELGVLPRGDVGAGFAVELAETFQHDRACRHVDPEGEGFGGEHGAYQAADEQVLDDLLEGGQHSGVVRGDPAFQAFQPLPVAEDAQIIRGDARRT